MKLAMAQTKMDSSIEANFEKTLRYMEMAKDCDLLFFPEVQWTPFFPQYQEQELQQQLGKTKQELLLSLEDVRIKTLRDRCREYGLWLSPNLYMEQNGKQYDMSLMIDQYGQLRDVSKMVHIAQAEHFYEGDYYTPSEEGFNVYETPFGKVGVVICFDRHFPESIRTCAAKGAELIIIPTANVKAEPMELFEWEIRVQAYQNNVFIAMCNRTGLEGDMDFAGESILVDCEGNVLQKANHDEQLLTCEIDLSKVYESRKRRPYIDLLRPDQYLIDSPQNENGGNKFSFL